MIWCISASSFLTKIGGEFSKAYYRNTQKPRKTLNGCVPKVLLLD